MYQCVQMVRVNGYEHDPLFHGRPPTESSQGIQFTGPKPVRGDELPGGSMQHYWYTIVVPFGESQILTRLCPTLGANVDVPALDVGEYYIAGSALYANACRCSTVVYSLLSACAICQSGTFRSYVPESFKTITSN